MVLRLTTDGEDDERARMPQIKQMNESSSRTRQIEEQKKRTQDQAKENKRKTETIEELKRKGGKS